jgi:hypothetical protein
MWKRIYVLWILLIFIECHQTEAQDTQNTLQSIQGVVLEALELDRILCVINTSNEGPQWFLLNSDLGGVHKRIGSISAASGLISDIKVAPDGKYAAILSVGEGHPLLEVIDLPKLLQEKTYTVLHKLDPYPGVIEIHSWDGDRLQVNSDMLLTDRDKSNGRVSENLRLSWQETFALNVLTGEISGISDGAKNPVEHYSRVLMDQQTSEAEKDMALSKLLASDSKDMAISFLLEILEKEQNPKRIIRLLEEIDKLRKKPQEQEK